MILYKELIINDTKTPKIPIIIAYASDVCNVKDNIIIQSTIVPITAIAIHFPFLHKHFLLNIDNTIVKIVIPNIIHIAVDIPVDIPVL